VPSERRDSLEGAAARDIDCKAEPFLLAFEAVGLIEPGSIAPDRGQSLAASCLLIFALIWFSRFTLSDRIHPLQISTSLLVGSSDGY
jgi:hypothetical protein